MEHLEGETLADRLGHSHERPLPLQEAQRFAIQIASALDRAHRAGIIHRDIKPGNIMLTKAGVKLLDFGLAKARATADAGVLTEMPTEAGLTGPGMILGTLQYMAPEQLEGKVIDARTDVFAFGVVLYEMVTGRKAFDGSSHATRIAAIVEHEPPRLSSTQPEATPALERIVSTCLAKDPDDRWQTSRDLLRALEWVALGPSEDAGAGPRPRSRIVASAALGVAIGALGMWVTSFLFGQETSLPRLTRFAIPLPSDAVISPTQNRQEAISPDGTQIVYAAVCRWAGTNGYSWVTLTTFRDAPWNMPFYERLGFEEIPPEERSPALLSVIEDETRRGLDPRLRVAMRRPCAPNAPAHGHTEHRS